MAAARCLLTDGGGQVDIAQDIDSGALPSACVGHETTASPAVAQSSECLLRGLLEAVPMGILAVDRQGRLQLANQLACRMLDLSSEAVAQQLDVRDLISELGSGSAAVPGGQGLFEVENRHGVWLEARAHRLSDCGVLVTIEDVSQRRQQERERYIAQEEYSSLFANAVCGIYRDGLDGTPVRCNPALAQLNGYSTEEEFISAVKSRPQSWYVQEGRAEEFRRLMWAEGGVKDFVSEVYRHRTGEKFWIMENAWFVRDREGNPLYIEGTIQDATERITTLSLIEKQANIDTLTGVASRFRFFNVLDALTGPDSEGCSLFSIDLDHFKEINDQMGHEAGDIALKAMAERLKGLAPDKAMLARIGGDEFALLVPYSLNEANAAELASAIVEAAAEPIMVRSHSLLMGASVGVAIYPTLATNFDELVGNADKALYTAKGNGRNGYCVFGAAMRSSSQARRILTSQLAQAIEADELELYYQPIVFSETGMVEGLEALLRWNHPTRGVVGPSEFLTLAEEEGLMAEIGDWVLKRACQQAALLPAHLQVSVNVSADQFRSSRIIETVKEALAASGLEPERLALEITETVILSSENLAKRVIGRLSEMGVAVALDDFGTAYSSLSYLQKFSFNKVKIDKSFVRGMFDIPADMAVVRAVIGIGRDLGIEIVAEGVETRMQMDRLQREGCKRMQGFYFSKPKTFGVIANELALAQITPLLETDEKTFQRRRK